MTTDPIDNPYAPPTTEVFHAQSSADVLLQARFIMTERWQRKIAYDLIMPGGLLLTSSMLVLIVSMALGAVLSPFEYTKGAAFNPYVIGAALIGFPIGSVGAVVFHIVAHRWLQLKNLQRLRAHAVLGAVGEWNIAANTTELRIHTPAGIANWPLNEIWWHPVHGAYVLLQAPGPIPIGIPKTSEVEPPRQGEFGKLMRLRVRRLPFT